MNLFQLGDFTLNSGVKSHFKIDCDALTEADLEAVAYLLCNKLPRFGDVEGVPRGGLRLADKLKVYATSGPLLIVDDVLTTGASMERFKAERYANGAVIFSRTPYYPTWITPLFSMIQ